MTFCYLRYPFKLMPTNNKGKKIKVSAWSPDIHNYTCSSRQPSLLAMHRAIIDPNLYLRIRSPLWFGGLNRCGMRSLHECGCHLESNPNPLIFSPTSYSLDQVGQ